MERTHASRCVILKANINQFCIVDWPEATCSTCGVFARMDASPLKLLITIATVHYYLPFIIWAAHLHCWPPANTFPGLSASTFHSLRAQRECFGLLWLWWWFGHECLRQRWFLSHPMMMIQESAVSAFSRLVHWADTESSPSTRTLLFNLLWTGRSGSDSWKLVCICRLGPFAQVSTDSFHPNGPLQEYLVSPEAAAQDHKLKSNGDSVANPLLLHHHITMISAGDGETEYLAWMSSFTSCYGLKPACLLPHVTRLSLHGRFYRGSSERIIVWS